MSDSIAPKRGEIWKVKLDPNASDDLLVLVVSLDEMAALGVRTCVPLVPRTPEHEDKLWEFMLKPDKGNCLPQQVSASTHMIRPIPHAKFAARHGRVDADVFDALLALIAFNIGFEA